MVITKDKNNNILQIEPNGVVISTNYIQTERDENMSKNNLIELEGKIIAINAFKHGSEYVTQVEIDVIPCDRVNNKYLKISFEKFFKSFQEHREFCGNFYLDLEVVVEGFLDENLKYSAKNIYFKGDNNDKN